MNAETFLLSRERGKIVLKVTFLLLLIISTQYQFILRKATGGRSTQFNKSQSKGNKNQSLALPSLVDDKSIVNALRASQRFNDDINFT